MANDLISPYGNELIGLLVDPDEHRDLFDFASTLPSIQLTQRQTCDLEMLATGAFSPVRTFMGKADFERVVGEMRLVDGTIFPIPVALSVNDLTSIKTGGKIALRDSGNDLLAVLDVEEIYEWDRDNVAASVFGTNDPRHPLVSEMARWGRYNLSGRLRVLNLPVYHDFADLRLTPRQTRERLLALGRPNVVAFQTRNPLHRAHEILTQRAIEITDGTLLLHPAVGMTKEGDIDHYTRVRTYKAVAEQAYPADRVLLSLLPLAMRMAGPREALWHAIIRRNYGANHLIVGRDHASPGIDSQGRPFYHPLAAQELAKKYSAETGVGVIAFDEFAYLPDEDRYEEAGKISEGSRTLSLSGTQVRRDYLGKGIELPDWFSRKEVASILSETYPPRNRQGVCIWFTGLSGSGKSTTAAVLVSLLLEAGRQATVLDGDVVRTHLSKGLGFSREDRDINVSRIGFVASEIVRHGGIAICAAVSPYRQARNQVRQMFREGNFVEVFVDTPLEVCEQRDAKGMYAKARRGEIKDFTGINDVYEEPESAEIALETVKTSAVDNARKILELLRTSGFVK
ncbi:MAG: bifunctional sulfate adenylyltransferase/adenylylsulfate kinase [Pyrinomonadaceae bacterium]